MTWYPVVAAIVLAIGYVVSQMWQKRDRDLGLPIVTTPPGKNASWAILEGHRKHPDTAFVVPTTPPTVILPMQLLDEVICSGEENISHEAELYDRFIGKYTNVGASRLEVTHTLRADLNKNIPHAIPLLQAEAKTVISMLRSPEDWTAVPLYETILQFVALLSGRIFVGLPLSRDPEWLKMTILYTEEVSAVERAARRWHPMIRTFVAPFLPEVKQVRQTLSRAQNFMEPLVSSLLADQEKEKSSPVKAGSYGSFISWILGNSPKEVRNARRIGEDQMLVSFAAIHTSSSTASMALLDLIAHPEYIQPLREEIENTIQEDGWEMDGDGIPYLRKSSFAKLKLLDSFLKESQRTSPISLVNHPRRVVVDYTFGNGLKLPKGTSIAFPRWGVYHSEKTPVYSPEANKDVGNPGPDVFDGYRFVRLRSIPGNETRHQAVTTGPDATNFGHGRAACPGRFFAMYMIKTLLIELLLNYDMRIQGDLEGNGGEDKRPKNLVYGLNNLPNPAAQFEIRKRKKV